MENMRISYWLVIKDDGEYASFLLALQNMVLFFFNLLTIR
jgi:hypothetical protein